MKRRRSVLLLVVLLLMCFFTCAITAYADDTTTVSQVSLEVYYDGKIQVESLTSGINVSSISGSRKKSDEWTTIKVTVVADDNYKFRMQAYSWSFQTDDDVYVTYKSMEKKSSNKIILSLSYYYDEDGYYYDNNRKTSSDDYDYDNKPYRKPPCDNEDYVDGYTSNSNVHIKLPNPNSNSTSSTTSKNGWVKSNGNWYYYVNGKKFTNDWKKINGYWYYFQSDGIMATSWVGNSYTYYTNPDANDPSLPEGAMVTGWRKITVYSGTYWYYFAPSGEKLVNQYVGNYWLDEQGRWIP